MFPNRYFPQRYFAPVYFPLVVYMAIINIVGGGFSRGDDIQEKRWKDEILNIKRNKKIQNDDDEILQILTFLMKSGVLD